MNGNFPTWIKIITNVGFPIALSVYLIVIFYPLITETNAQIKDHVEQVAQMIDQRNEQTRLLKVICRNVATNDFERSNCDIK